MHGSVSVKAKEVFLARWPNNLRNTNHAGWSYEIKPLPAPPTLADQTASLYTKLFRLMNTY